MVGATSLVKFARSSRKDADLGLDKHLLFENGNTLLHYAQDKEWIDLLFNAGFKYIDHRNLKGNTALMEFVPHRGGLAKEILTRGCNVNYRDNRGKTAVHIASAGTMPHGMPSYEETLEKATLFSSSLNHKILLSYAALFVRCGAFSPDNCCRPYAPGEGV